jgi:hypothetical protein
MYIGPATSAGLGESFFIAVGNSGDIYFEDYTNHRVRTVSKGTGMIRNIAGTGVAGIYKYMNVYICIYIYIYIYIYEYIYIYIYE